jgi:hypothetical protein
VTRLYYFTAFAAREKPNQNTTWDAAKSWTDSLTVGGGGWLMPTIAELRGLYQEGKGSRNMDPIFVTTCWYIWSCDDVTVSSARFFHFRHGTGPSNNRNDSSSNRAFAVRLGKRG